MDTSDVLALGALLISGLSALNVDRKHKALERTILERQVAEQEALAAAAERADLAVSFYQVGNARYKFELSNNGLVSASDVEFTACESSAARSILLSEGSFVIDTFEPGDRRAIHSRGTMGDIPPFKTRLAWTDPDGTRQERTNSFDYP